MRVTVLAWLAVCGVGMGYIYYCSVFGSWLAGWVKATTTAAAAAHANFDCYFYYFRTPFRGCLRVACVGDDCFHRAVEAVGVGL